MTFTTRGRRLALGAGTALLLAFAVAPAFAADHTVNIVGLTFEPAEITVAVGDTVTWEVTESIGAPHSVTSGTPDDPDKGSVFDSGAEGLIEVGETFEFTFDSAGTYAYYCTVHGASMSGQVVVGEAGASEPPVASEPPASEPPAGSEPPAASEPPGASGGPGASGAPGPSEPPHELKDPIPTESKLLAAGVLGAVIVILFGAAAVWRRMNPA
jgi:plastocyanin